MIESAQKRVEGNNFDLRKTLLQYDDVVNQQRKIIYERRNEIIDRESVNEFAIESIEAYIEDLVLSHLGENDSLTELDLSEINETLNERILKEKLTLDDVKNKSIEELIEFLIGRVTIEYKNKIEVLPKEIVNEFEKAIILRVIDTHWMEHINTMAHLREGIGLRGYAQEDPLRAYTNEGFELFDELLRKIDKEVSLYLLNAEVRQNTERTQVAEGKAVATSGGEVKLSRKERRKAGSKYKI